MQNSYYNYFNNRHPLLQALPIGYCFNEFEIEKIIGKGGFGIVYKAWDHRKKCAVAIKEYLPSAVVIRRNDLKLNLRCSSLQKRFKIGLHSFMREAHIMSYFNHPCLPRFLRFWQQNSTAYIATPFYRGITLKLLQLKHPKIITQNWLCRILFSLFDALNTLHQAGYLHCDISLDNILIQNNQLPILLDLGSARKTTEHLSDDEEITVRSGFTPCEQYTANEEGQQGPWTDIYALGAVLHTLIVGKPPPVSIVRSIEDHYQPLTKRCPTGYSLSFLHVIDCMLAIKVSDRPPSISKLAAMIKPAIIQACQIPTSHLPFLYQIS
ncbi:serine/threonine protein kinase [Xenorhabdus budapestensis]|uniref:non-specific serine/threonine protein kinase n=1 Tax=Xenorhabdus budapestensis TaxID=290110 RepID=A0A2D0J315_XENBU|nr:serine/threonine-protein kinase [Xenorhabdus budapestensis]PHM28591.1 serine/threonine-protein kinase PknH [Xenorhabdus budapestensis]QTL41477.1 serine/threonine protein kinase [Xenorhabdus budapestensis]